MTRHVTPYAGPGQNPEVITVHVDLADRAEIENWCRQWLQNWKGRPCPGCNGVRDHHPGATQGPDTVGKIRLLTVRP